MVSFRVPFWLNNQSRYNETVDWEALERNKNMKARYEAATQRLKIDRGSTRRAQAAAAEDAGVHENVGVGRWAGGRF